jgi:hypothetical protein
MRVAALYDIHGNLPALEAVLQEIRQAELDRVVVGATWFRALVCGHTHMQFDPNDRKDSSGECWQRGSAVCGPTRCPLAPAWT